MFNNDTITPDFIGQEISRFKKGGEVQQFEDVMDQQPEISDSFDMLSGGNWYATFPDRNLGEIVIDKDRYGKQIKVVIGNISNLDRISVSDDFSQFIKFENIGVSDTENTLFSEFEKPENAKFIQDIIASSNVSIGKKAVKKKIKEQSFSEELSTPDVSSKIQSFETIFKTLNPDISQEELKAYVWHKADIGQQLSSDWYEMSGLYDDERTEETMVLDWVKSGVLCYFAGSLIPQALYLSGDMYAKVNRLIKEGDNSGYDAETIIERYGNQVLQQQIMLLNNKYATVYSKRLIITGSSDDNSLIIKPISDLAKKFMISSLQEFEEFKWWNKKGVPNWEREDGRSYDKMVFPELSLKDAFCFWLLNVGSKLDIRGNITYNDIIYFYIDGRTKVTPSNLITDFQVNQFKADLARTKSKSMAEGERLFLVFLDEQLELNDRIRLETSWNSQYNNYLAPDFNRIPVAFNVAKDFGGESPFIVKPEKREAVSFLFNEGSGCLAYDVGVGKTMSAIMATEQFLVAGYCKRPFIVVPNQTYKQWISEIRAILPHRTINPLFNLGVDYIEEVQDENGNTVMVPEGSITVITYEGLRQIGFNEQTENDLLGELYAILNQGGQDEAMSEKKKASFHEKLSMLIGKGLKGTVLSIEDLGFDYSCYDEAHALKKVFTTVKGAVDKETGKKDGKNPYSINSGMPSDTALKGFMLSQYILRNNNYRNVVMLTATPFTNSPLEVFSMLSMLAYHQLENLGINNLKDFFDTFIDASTELTINHKLQPQYKQVIKGFNNLPALQRVILRFFNYKDGDDVGVVRPSKIVVPYLKKLVNNVVVDLPEEEKVGCYLSMTATQKRYMEEITAYAEGTGELGTSASFMDEEDSNEDTVKDSSLELISENALSSDEKSGVRALKAMNHSRNLALSPYLYTYNTLGAPDYMSYIKTSPKLQYVMDCIKSVKEYHESNSEPVSGQVIYMDRGIQYFPLISEYLVKEVGFKPHEIGMIFSKGMTVDKKRAVQDGFLGRKYNEKSQEYEDIPDSQRIKVLIGSSSIKEGMNLQKKSTVLYNCFLDWNPTDMIQLQGRIWRQQNEFLYVRIVNPLVIDSIDIFMFQKLEEKTSRLNTIWSNDGKSILKIEEVNPSEIKYALIKDPKVIAKIEVDEKKIHIEDDIRSSMKVIERIERFKTAKQYIDNYSEEITALSEKIFPDRLFNDEESRFKAINTFLNKENQYDSEGLIMLPSYLKRYDLSSVREKYKAWSEKDRIEKPYWLSMYVVNMRLVAKETKDLLKPRNIIIDGIDEYIKFVQEENTIKKEQVKFLESDDYVDKRVLEIVEYREKNQVVEKTVQQLVSEFKRLNNLLSLKRIKEPRPLPLLKFERLDADGKPKIDADSIENLEKLVLNLPQTKDFHTDINGDYTEERRKLHIKIIDNIKKEVSCITKEQPIAIFTGGSPASGKSTFLKSYAPYLLSKEIFKIDADEVRAMLPEYEGWNATATHTETKDIINQLLTDKEIGVPCMFDVIYDGTMNSSKNYLPLIGTLKKLGYKIFIIYMDNIPYSVVKDRMLNRYRSSGRYVPIQVLEDFFGAGKAALFELRDKVDGYMVIDAGSKDYRILEQGGEPLPEDRTYSELQNINEVKAANEKQRPVSKTEKIKERISKLKTKPDSEKVRQDLQDAKIDLVQSGQIQSIISEPTESDFIATIEGLEILLTFTTDKEEIKNINATLEGLKLIM